MAVRERAEIAPKMDKKGVLTRKRAVDRSHDQGSGKSKMATWKAEPKGSWEGADGPAHPTGSPLGKLQVSDLERLEKLGLVLWSISMYFYPDSILDQTKTRDSSNLSHPGLGEFPLQKYWVRENL